jgi:hypothetical protein
MKRTPRTKSTPTMRVVHAGGESEPEGNDLRPFLLGMLAGAVLMLLLWMVLR